MTTHYSDSRRKGTFCGIPLNGDYAINYGNVLYMTDCSKCLMEFALAEGNEGRWLEEEAQWALREYEKVTNTRFPTIKL